MTIRRAVPLAMTAFGLLALTPAAGKPAADPEAQIKARITSLYSVYKRATLPTGYGENLTPYTARTRQLITRWRKGLPSDEVTDMGDFDWFCQCQDWDAKAFALKTIIVRKGSGATYDAAVTYNLGWDADRSLRLVMVQENGGWKVDDIIFANESPPRALRAALTAELKEPRK